MTSLLIASEHWHTDGYHGHDGPWFPFFPLAPIFFIALWILVFRTVGRRRWRHLSGHSGESVLAERFARGEIDEPEYRQRRAALRSKD